jgi:bifunctional non-homologous end joining protein LigD
MSEVVMLCQRGEYGQFPQGWINEPKLDGTRAKAVKQGDRVKLINRRGGDYADKFPEIIADLQRMDGDFTIDGEICSKDFSTLAGRAHLTDPFRIELLSRNQPCTYHVFDILQHNGSQLAGLPLIDRKRFLYALGESEHIKIVMHQPLELLIQQVEAGEIEGIVAKNPNSIYEFRRSPSWVKFRKEDTEDLPIIGFEDTDKKSRPFRSLIMLRNGKEVQASSGLSGTDLRMLDEIFKGKPQRVVGTKRYFDGPVGIAEVKFYGQSPDIPYRFPRVERLRFDKKIEV